jgi:hypothetical protein
MEATTVVAMPAHLIGSILQELAVEQRTCVELRTALATACLWRVVEGEGTVLLVRTVGVAVILMVERAKEELQHKFPVGVELKFQAELLVIRTPAQPVLKDHLV